MRIAISGTHAVGKTTLAEALSDALPGHVLVPEPYRLLEDEGHDFADPPSVEDFVAQLERSLHCLTTHDGAAIFDRMPLDLLGYLDAHEDGGTVDVDDWLSRIRAAVATLDLIVFVPIETPDRLPVAREERRYRARIDGALRTLVLDDPHDLGVATIEVAGAVDARVRQVLAHLNRAGRVAAPHARS